MTRGSFVAAALLALGGAVLVVTRGTGFSFDPQYAVGYLAALGAALAWSSPIGPEWFEPLMVTAPPVTLLVPAADAVAAGREGEDQAQDQADHDRDDGHGDQEHQQKQEQAQGIALGVAPPQGRLSETESQIAAAASSGAAVFDSRASVAAMRSSGRL